MQDPSPPERQRRRISVRMSLRVFMALVVLLGVVLGWVIHRARLQREAVAAIERAGGVVCYDREWKGDREIPGGKPWVRRWLMDRIGVDYFSSVTMVHLRSRESDAEPLVSQVGHLDRLEDLGLNGPGVTDAALVHLTGLSRLKVLALGSTRVSDAGVNELRQDLPMTKVHQDKSDKLEFDGRDLNKLNSRTIEPLC